MWKRRIAGWLERLPPLRWGLKQVVRFFAASHYVGAVGVVFNEAGQVLLAEHVFRPDYAWGLPGGWVERGEDPAQAVARELREELNLSATVGPPLLIVRQGYEPKTSAPPGLKVAFFCRVEGQPAIRLAPELVSIRWVDPAHIPVALAETDMEAISLGQQYLAQGD